MIMFNKYLSTMRFSLNKQLSLRKKFKILLIIIKMILYQMKNRHHRTQTSLRVIITET
jgi:hypothetical protein